MEETEVLILLLLLLGDKDLGKVLVPLGAAVRVCGLNNEYAGTSALPETMATCVTVFDRDPGEGLFALLCLLLLALLLSLLLAFLLALAVGGWVQIVVRGGLVTSVYSKD